MTPPLIALEEHFISSAILSQLTPDSPFVDLLKAIPGLRNKLADVGPLRLENMDKGQISFQIISHTPGDITADEAHAINAELSECITSYPNRFGGFAVLPVSDPNACAKELTRCVRELGFVGALIDNHTSKGGYFDGDEYLPLFEAAVHVDVPIYLHPTWPTDSMKSLLYEGNFSESATRSISASAFGWHSDVAIHILRLFAAGLFDKFPKLKIIIGHMGEMLPFMLGRIILISSRWNANKRDFKRVWEENIWITTSGKWGLEPLACILRNTPIDHILYSVDYPFATNESGLSLMKELELSGLVDEEGLKKICYQNSEKLLGVKATKVFR